MHKIVGGKEVQIGMRVFTNDWQWGTILDTPNNVVSLGMPHEPLNENADTCQAWFDVELDSGTRRAYDCTRMATRKPQ